MAARYKNNACSECYKAKQRIYVVVNNDAVKGQKRAYWASMSPDQKAKQTAISRAYREANKERLATARKKKYLENRAELRKKAKETRPKYAEKMKKYHRTYRYGITDEQYQTMLIEQHGRCACCWEQDKLVVDHDHKTGTVRGLLCSPCNKGMGFFRDDIRNLKTAIMYLKMCRK